MKHGERENGTKENGTKLRRSETMSNRMQARNERSLRIEGSGDWRKLRRSETMGNRMQVRNERSLRSPKVG